MPRPLSSPFPADALSWLVPQRQSAILAIGRSTASLAARFRAMHHELTAADPTVEGVHVLHNRLPGSLTTVAEPEALPFAPYSFDTVLCSQNFHTFAPGLALAEFARVLRLGGDLSAVYVQRDDSVPWVKRLIALMREADPDAMPGAYGADSLQAIEDSHYFPTVERRGFRQWVPVSRIQLMEMVASSPSSIRLDADRLNQLVTDVGTLYDTSARAPEPLLLPYRITCVRGRVDHTALTNPIELADDALRISLDAPR